MELNWAFNIYDLTIFMECLAFQYFLLSLLYIKQQYMQGLNNTKDIKALFESLNIDTKDLVDYKTLYGTTINTWTYKGCSSWAYTYNPITGNIGVRTAYFDTPQAVKNYNNNLE